MGGKEADVEVLWRVVREAWRRLLLVGWVCQPDREVRPGDAMVAQYTVSCKMSLLRTPGPTLSYAAAWTMSSYRSCTMS